MPYLKITDSNMQQSDDSNSRVHIYAKDTINLKNHYSSFDLEGEQAKTKAPKIDLISGEQDDVVYSGISITGETIDLGTDQIAIRAYNRGFKADMSMIKLNSKEVVISAPYGHTNYLKGTTTELTLGGQSGLPYTVNLDATTVKIGDQITVTKEGQFPMLSADARLRIKTEKLTVPDNIFLLDNSNRESGVQIYNGFPRFPQNDSLSSGGIYVGYFTTIYNGIQSSDHNSINPFLVTNTENEIFNNSVQVKSNSTTFPVKITITVKNGEEIINKPASYGNELTINTKYFKIGSIS